MSLTKIQAVKIIKKMEEVYSQLGNMGDEIYEEDISLSQKIYDVIGDLVFITDEILGQYPCLRPVAILPENFNGSYRIVKYDKRTKTEMTVNTSVQPCVAEKTLRDIEAANCDNNLIFYLELN